MSDMIGGDRITGDRAQKKMKMDAKRDVMSANAWTLPNLVCLFVCLSVVSKRIELTTPSSNASESSDRDRTLKAMIIAVITIECNNINITIQQYYNTT